MLGVGGALGLCACVPDPAPTGRGGGPGRGDSGLGDGPETAVLATVSQDYAVGALATVDLSGWTVTDQITDLSGDPAVVVAGGHLFQLERYGFDVVRVFEPGDWSAPRVEFALADLANPQDVAMCGPDAVISQLGSDALAVYDPTTGLRAGSVDLSPWADADGLPEATDLVDAGDGWIYVAVRNFDRDAGWASAGGAVLELSCDGLEITREWAFDSPTLALDPADPDTLLVTQPGGDVVLLDRPTGATRVVLEGGSMDGVIEQMVVHEGAAMGITVTPDYAYGVVCLDLAMGAAVARPTPDRYLISIAANAHGEAWVSARTHWDAPEAPFGVQVWDIATCTEQTAGRPLQTLLAPYSVAFY